MGTSKDRLHKKSQIIEAYEYVSLSQSGRYPKKDWNPASARLYQKRSMVKNKGKQVGHTRSWQ